MTFLLVIILATLVLLVVLYLRSIRRTGEAIVDSVSAPEKGRVVVNFVNNSQSDTDASDRFSLSVPAVHGPIFRAAVGKLIPYVVYSFRPRVDSRRQGGASPMSHNDNK
ncbi:MAG: hypothetical protein PVI21_05200 [Candidatus Woesebacteria bacterium]|jgi:hypothetical protein